jgi:hypothetical protein
MPLSERKQVPPIPVNTPRSPELDLKAEREKLKQELLGTEQCILERLEKRDQSLIQHVREIQETKRMIAAAQQKNGGNFGKSNEFLIKQKHPSFRRIRGVFLFG